MTKSRRLTTSLAMLLISALLLSTASYAWFAMNTQTNVEGLEVEAYTDSLFLEISTTGADDSYSTAVKYDPIESAHLRLVTASLFGNYQLATISATPASGNYDEGTTYYEQVTGKFGTADYVKVDGLSTASSTADCIVNPVFELQVTNAKVSGDYYAFDAATNTYTKQTLNQASAYGLWEITSSANNTGLYDGASRYYKETNGVLADITNSLVAASDVSGYYTVAATPCDLTAKAVGTQDYYLVNSNGYAYVGPIVNDTVLGEYLFWGKAYSTDPANVQGTNPLTILDPASNTDAISNYYLTKTVYLRQAEGTNNAENLVINVDIGGASNPLSGAIRVLFVATTTADATSPKRISYAIYDPNSQNANGMTYSNGENLFGTILGDENETITVDMYIYFDGTDEVAKNASVVDAVLNGQTIDIQFSIDEHDYNN